MGGKREMQQAWRSLGFLHGRSVCGEEGDRRIASWSSSSRLINFNSTKEEGT